MKRTTHTIVGLGLFAGAVVTFARTGDGRVALGALILGVLGLYFFSRGVTADYSGYFQEINGPMESAREAIANLLSAAPDNGEIKILSGTLTPDIYLREPVFAALKEAVDERGVRVKILLGEPDAGWDYWPWREGADEKSFETFKGWVKSSRIEVKRPVSERFSPHFIVVDDLHLRIEEPHAKRKRGDKPQKRTAMIHYLEPKLAATFSERFAKYAAKAESFGMP